MVESVDIKKFVNEIFAKKGHPAVKNFPQEFADGSKYLSALKPIFSVKF